MNIKRSKDLNEELRFKKKLIREMKRVFLEKEGQVLDMSLMGTTNDEIGDEGEGNFQLLKERKYFQDAQNKISQAQGYATNIGEEMNRQNEKMRSFNSIVIFSLI